MQRVGFAFVAGSLAVSLAAFACTKSEDVDPNVAPTDDAGTTADSDASTADSGATGNTGDIKIGNEPAPVVAEQNAIAVACDEDKVFDVTLNGTEFIRLAAEFSRSDGAVGGSNPEVELSSPTDESLSYDGNPLTLGGGEVISGAAASKQERDVILPADLSGTYKLHVRNPAPCAGPVLASAKVLKLVGAATNLTKETAITLAKGAPVPGTLGCEQDRFYAITAAAGETLSIKLRAQKFSALSNGGGQVGVGLYNEDGTEIVANGNPIAGEVEIATAVAETTVTYTPEAAAKVVLRVQHPFQCGSNKFEIGY